MIAPGKSFLDIRSFYKNDPNYRHLRHAVRELKAAKEQLLVEKIVPVDARAKAEQDIAAAIELLEKALETAK